MSDVVDPETVNIPVMRMGGRVYTIENSTAREITEDEAQRLEVSARVNAVAAAQASAEAALDALLESSPELRARIAALRSLRDAALSAPLPFSTDDLDELRGEFALIEKAILRNDEVAAKRRLDAVTAHIAQLTFRSMGVNLGELIGAAAGGDDAPTSGGTSVPSINNSAGVAIGNGATASVQTTATAVSQTMRASGGGSIRNSAQIITGNARVGTAIQGDVAGDLTVVQQHSQAGGVNLGSNNTFANGLTIGSVAGHDTVRVEITEQTVHTTQQKRVVPPVRPKRNRY